MRYLALIGCIGLVGCGVDFESVVTAERRAIERQKHATGALCLSKGGVPIYNWEGHLTNCVLACRE